MRVLVPLPFDVSCQAHGRNLRVTHLLRELSDRAEVTVAVRGPIDAARQAERLFGRSQIKCFDRQEANPARETDPTPLNGPWWVRRAADYFDYNGRFHAWIRQLSAQADVVLGFDLVSAFYLMQGGKSAGREKIPNGCGQRPATICDLIDDPWLTFRNSRRCEQYSIAGAKTALAVQAIRRWLLPQLDVLVAVAPRDAESLSRTTGRPVHVVPNGVEVPATVPNPGCRESLIVFTGAMSFPPNEQAACYLVKDIWPRVRRLVPRARLAVVGANPSLRVRRLAHEPGVTVTGRVADIRAWLACARVAAAPMLGGTGLKNKILEACAQGCPVVATSLAAAGIPAGQENGIWVADDPAIFAAHLTQLLIDPRQAERLGQAGAAMARERMSWPRAAEALRRALLESRQVTANRSADALPVLTSHCEEGPIHAAS